MEKTTIYNRSSRTPFSDLLEITCAKSDKLELCENCKELKNINDEASFKDAIFRRNIEENLKISLKIPIDTPVQFSSLKTSENIVFLQFAMNLSFAEHDKMMDTTICLMR